LISSPVHDPPYNASTLLFFFIIRRHPTSPLFPYTTLFRSSSPTRPAATAPRTRRRGSTARRCAANRQCSPAATSCRRAGRKSARSEEHTSEPQSQSNLVCRLLLEKKKTRVSVAKMRGHHTH